jgi:hypothetical protein
MKDKDSLYLKCYITPEKSYIIHTFTKAVHYLKLKL